jgi:hypothetical protein
VRPTSDTIKQDTKPLPWSIAVPHTATEDGFYDGYFIPKGALFLLASVQLIDPPIFAGAMVSGNAWSANGSTV